MKSRVLCYGVALMLAGCGSDSATPSGAVALVNGIPDSDGLQASAFGSPRTSPIADLSASTLGILAAGSYPMLLTPGAAGSTPFTVDIGIGQGELTTLVAYGSVTANTQGGLTAEVSLAAAPSGQVVVQVVNAAYNLMLSEDLGEMGFAFQIPGTTISPEAPTYLSVDFGPVTTAQSIALADGQYEIVVTASAICNLSVSVCTANSRLVFDTGPSGVSLPATDGAGVYQLIAIDGATQGSIQLLLFDSSGNLIQLVNTQPSS